MKPKDILIFIFFPVIVSGVFYFALLMGGTGNDGGRANDLEIYSSS